MTFEQILKEHDRDSFARGLDQGRSEGRAEGEAAGLERGLEQGRSEGEAAGLEKGLERGLEQGRNEGAVQKQREIAKNLKGLGIALKEIVKATGLSETEVAKL